jgi:cytochrome P450 family 110
LIRSCRLSTPRTECVSSATAERPCSTPTVFEYLPFGGGFRRCPGAAFANYELAISIGALMKTVELRKPPRSVPRGIAVVPRREVWLDIIGRR